MANLALFSYPCVRNSYVFFGTVQLSICEEILCALCIALHYLVIHMWGTLMCLFGTVHLSICEELLCAFCWALLLIINTCFIYSRWLWVVGMASSWWLIVHHWSVYDGIYPSWYEFNASNWSCLLSCLWFAGSFEIAGSYLRYAGSWRLFMTSSWMTTSCTLKPVVVNDCI